MYTSWCLPATTPQLLPGRPGCCLADLQPLCAAGNLALRTGAMTQASTKRMTGSTCPLTASACARIEMLVSCEALRKPCALRAMSVDA